ncbi:hypothetical protein PLESTB_001833800 [Pleodorina starrii]|jgi:osmotically-inducible protein OsmY|uniref:BON domain-containing protein n=1 Tax=Pleodorina starrii TaxID=330485 RepID=A0A9W6C208_9CHLO|nr:hypothetical protein PLESTB_001833800 [Pleodorina starrii]
MANEYNDRDRMGRPSQDYGNRDMNRNSRDWTDKATDEVKSWVGDGQAERRRDMDEVRENRDRYSVGNRSANYDRGYGQTGGYGRDDDGHGRRGGLSADPRTGWSHDRSVSNSGYGRGDQSYGRGRVEQDDDRGFLDRAGDEVASWFGDEDASRRREMDKHRGTGPKGYIRSDERIKEDVSERLMDDGQLDASDIEVMVQDGEVTLTGTVPERFAKRHAEDVAERASGVKHVQNNLRVASAGQTGTSATSPLVADPTRDRGIL